MAKMWAGRTSGVTDSIADDFNSSIRFDCKMYKEDITGYIAECWHIRYVGLPHSIDMRDRNLCLEEYLGKME